MLVKFIWTQKVKLDDINVDHRKYYLVKADVRHRLLTRSYSAHLAC